MGFLSGAALANVSIAIADGVNPTIAATVLDLTSSNPLTVAVTDANGNQITTFGGQAYAVGATAGATDTGTLALVVRDDVLTTLTPVDGKYTQMRTGQWGDLWVSLATKLDSTNDSVTADTELPAAATIAADAVTPTVPGLAAYSFIKTPGANTWDRMYSIVNATNSTGTGIVAAGLVAQLDNTSPTSITENQFGNLRMSPNRSLFVTYNAQTATLSNVASSASNVTILASNTARLGATIFNDSSAILYVKFGTTASVSSYTVQIAANSYYEVPFGYTAIIDGIWASATGNARVTELT